METQRNDMPFNGSRTKTPEAGGPVARPVGDLLKDLLHESGALVRGEVQLLRTEMSEKLAQVQRGVVSTLGGAAVLFAGVLSLLAAAVFGLGEIMPLWASALLVGAVVTIAGAVMVVAGKKKLEAENLKPERIIQEAKAETQFLKEKLS